MSLSLTTFATQVLADFQSTAAVVPSSRMLTQAMVEPLPLRDAKFVIELGPGTGVMTRELLELVPQDAEVLAFEVSPRFVEYLHQSLEDPRLEIVHAGAEAAAEALRDRGWERVDAVVSSLGLGFMPDSQQRAILSGLMPFLGEQSVFTQFQYVHRMQPTRKTSALLRRGRSAAPVFSNCPIAYDLAKHPPRLRFQLQKNSPRRRGLDTAS